MGLFILHYQGLEVAIMRGDAREIEELSVSGASGGETAGLVGELQRDCQFSVVWSNSGNSHFDSRSQGVAA